MEYSDICKILQQEPSLSVHGFAKGDELELREEIYFHQWELDACIEWIQPMKKIKSINRLRKSSNYKHMVEQASGMYISNGVFIVAAIHCGYRYECLHGHTTYFNISHKPIKAWEKEHGYAV